MPVPWASVPTRIPRVEHRAITIRQLRDLHVFVQRLCKTRLLRQADGDPISIFDVNMYHLADLVIRPAIRWAEELRGTRQQYSWVEFVAEAGDQPPDMMISHSWSGRFHDFMAVVSRLARSHGFGGNVRIWICTFANSQFGEDFGSGLRDCPFYKAIQEAHKGVVLVVDRDASSLQRIWCGFELNCSLRLERWLEVYTSAGQVGRDVTNGPLVEAIEAWDVTRMEASQDSDRRQILNYLGGGELRERDGLKVDADGNLVLLDGWQKQLGFEETTESAPRRAGGKQEYSHEAGLFSAHAEKFHRLNLSVKEKVLQAAQAESGVKAAEEPCKISSLTSRSITLGELRKLVKKLKAVVAAKGEQRWEDITISHVAEVMLPSMVPEGFCYAELVSSGPTAPQFLIDETWQSSFHGAMSAIEWFVEAKQLANSVPFFFSPFCLDARRTEEETHQWDQDMKTMIMNCEGLLCVLPKTRELIVRSNRLQQLQCCFEHARRIHVGCPSGVLACTAPFEGGVWEFGNFDVYIARILMDARWEEARCANKAVQARVREQVSNSNGGFAGFQARLARVVAGPILRHAASQGSVALKEMESICRSGGFLINSPVMRGALGETPLHIAAASGNTSGMELLLGLKADPNAEDDLRETPVHYAAMCGMAGAVRLLLQNNACAAGESAFAERPLCVAQQNPAAFLGRDTSRVVTLLNAWGVAFEEGCKDQATLDAAVNRRQREGSPSEFSL